MGQKSFSIYVKMYVASFKKCYSFKNVHVIVMMAAGTKIRQKALFTQILVFVQVTQSLQDVLLLRPSSTPSLSCCSACLCILPLHDCHAHQSNSRKRPVRFESLLACVQSQLQGFGTVLR